jgi:hypothetical protein
MKLKKIAAGIGVAGVLGVASGLGAGQAQADDWCWPDWCDVDVPPPGHFVPSPGHISQLPFVPPPGHWNKPGKWFK